MLLVERQTVGDGNIQRSARVTLSVFTESDERGKSRNNKGTHWHKAPRSASLFLRAFFCAIHESAL